MVEKKNHLYGYTMYQTRNCTKCGIVEKREL
jgi:hypothetical protein